MMALGCHQAADRAVIRWRARLEQRLHAHDPAIRSFANNDAAESSEMSDAPVLERIGILLVTGSRLATDLASRIYLAPGPGWN